MALSRERIADELLKLLGLPDPSPTVALMLERASLRRSCPRSCPTPPTRRGARRRRARGDIEPDPLRRLAALLPRDPLLAEKVAARLKLRNKARKRLAYAADPTLDRQPPRARLPRRPPSRARPPAARGPARRCARRCRLADPEPADRRRRPRRARRQSRAPPSPPACARSKPLGRGRLSLRAPHSTRSSRPPWRKMTLEPADRVAHWTAGTSDPVCCFSSVTTRPLEAESEGRVSVEFVFTGSATDLRAIPACGRSTDVFKPWQQLAPS